MSRMSKFRTRNGTMMRGFKWTAERKQFVGLLIDFYAKQDVTKPSSLKDIPGEHEEIIYSLLKKGTSNRRGPTQTDIHFGYTQLCLELGVENYDDLEKLKQWYKIYVPMLEVETTHLIYRPMKCPLHLQNCSKRVCRPHETYTHLKNDHQVEEKCSFEQREGILSFSHQIQFSFGSIFSGISDTPVLLSNPQNVVLSYAIRNGILVWWVCSETLNVVCKEYKYDAFIKTSAASQDEDLIITGLSLPIYGIRYIRFQKLQKINGAFSTFSANTLFYKKYKSKKYDTDDFVDVTIVVKLIPA